jgi:hypothetical protein
MAQLPIKTRILDIESDQIKWPNEVNEEAYTIVYSHSSLYVGKDKIPLDTTTLYEAWAFDGVRSWHIWKKDTEWVCSTYDTSVLPEDHQMEVIHFLAKHVSLKLNKTKLVIHQTIDYDQDGQAYIAYACPINFK